MGERSSFSGGFLLGGIIGLLIGVLSAPTSGEETREKIRAIKDQVLDDADLSTEKTETLIEKTRESIEEGFETLGKIIEKSKSKAADTEKTETAAG